VFFYRASGIWPFEYHARREAVQTVLKNGYRISREQLFQGKSGPIRVVLYAWD
jgi:hypothetical protein